MFGFPDPSKYKQQESHAKTIVDNERVSMISKQFKIC